MPAHPAAMTELARATVIVLDSVGIGALPDAAAYGDEGSNTLGNTARAVGGLALPNLGRLGLGNLTAVEGTPPIPVSRLPGSIGRMATASVGKDTITGHWELMGIRLARAIPTYPHGFPPAMLGPFEDAVGRKALGNRPVSGTAIIAELGEEHMRTGRPIVYTSADSVFQIAAHEDVVPVERLYEWCEIARRLYDHGQPFVVGRVIARPFVGRPGAFARTDRRRDYALPPPEPTALEAARAAGVVTVGVGKIGDVFSGRGLARSEKTHGNADGIRATLRVMDETGACAAGGAGAAGPGAFGGTGAGSDAGRGTLIFTNLVDFDMLYGHRNDPAGYAAALRAFDQALPDFLARLGGRDMLVITADHGCDPTTPSTDHSREYVPLLLVGPAVRAGVDLGTRASLSDLGATLAEALGFAPPRRGVSFWQEARATGRE